VYQARLLEQRRDRATEDALARNERYLQMTFNFAGFAIDNFAALANIPDRPYFLFEGMAGLATLLLDLQDPENSMFPCFEFC